MQSMNRHRMSYLPCAKTIDGKNETNGIKVNPREYIGLKHTRPMYNY